MIPLAEALASYVTTLRLQRPGLSRAGFEAAQSRTLTRWLVRDLPRVAAYRAVPRHLTDLPVTDKATLMADFAAYNVAGISAEAARDAIGRDCRIGALTVGASTGTSGNRGLFVISEAERFRWLGSLLAKALADRLHRPQRIAIVLPQDTRLYHSARRLRWLDLRFFGLTRGPEAWRAELEAFAPNVIVAPPRVLRHFAEEGFRLAPARVFSAAETLDPVDRPVIEAAFGLRLDQIYMATEGLLAVTCRHGGLHLAEDSVFFEFEEAGEGLVSPLITSFRRQTQIMARYRMNDLLRLAPGPCSCGSPLRLVTEVAGRADDCFRLPTAAREVLLTPDILRNAVVKASAEITDFRLIQTAPGVLVLILPPTLPDAAAGAALEAVTMLLKARGARATITLERQVLPLDPARKLRRVECRLPRAGR